MKQMPMWVSLVAACALAAACSHERTNEDSKGGQPAMHKYSKLVVFGDGLSDQGQFGRLTDNRYPPRSPFWVGARDGGAELLISIAPGDTKIEAPLR